jgi:hypothetical protein
MFGRSQMSSQPAPIRGSAQKSFIVFAPHTQVAQSVSLEESTKQEHERYDFNPRTMTMTVNSDLRNTSALRLK